MKRNLLTMLLALVAALGCQAQIFYKVEGNGLSRPSYLFGTHHFASEAILDSVPQARQALKEIECVVGELDMTGNPMALVQEMQAHMMAPADSTLSKLIPADRYAKADSIFTSLTGGMVNLAMIDNMKPMMAETTLSGIIAAKEMPQTGQIDSYFQNLAKRDSIEVQGLETADFQAHVLFDIIPLDRQAESLLSTLDNPDKILADVKALNEAYISRDADRIWNFAKEAALDSEGEFFEILLNRRNAAWLEKLPGMMADKPLFVAVGALHLYGDGGLVEGLRKLGYTVTPM